MLEVKWNDRRIGGLATASHPNTRTHRRYDFKMETAWDLLLLKMQMRLRGKTVQMNGKKKKKKRNRDVWCAQWIHRLKGIKDDMDACVYIFLFSSTNLVPIIFPHNINEEEEREQKKHANDEAYGIWAHSFASKAPIHHGERKYLILISLQFMCAAFVLSFSLALFGNLAKTHPDSINCMAWLWFGSAWLHLVSSLYLLMCVCWFGAPSTLSVRFVFLVKVNLLLSLLLLPLFASSLHSWLLLLLLLFHLIFLSVFLCII